MTDIAMGHDLDDDDPSRPNSDWWYRRAGAVYFFGAGDPMVAIKIGVTTIRKDREKVQEEDWNACIRHRHKQIQSSNHEPIKLLGIIRFGSGDRPARDAELRERALHKKFEKLQLFKPHTMGAEWFKAQSELLSYIEETKQETRQLENYQNVIAVPINR
jgi:T5orf172 domain